MESLTSGQSRVKQGRVWIVARFLEANTGRTLTVKLIMLLITGALVCVPAFVLRGEVLANHLTTETEFIYITEPLFNKGVAWSGLSGANPSLIIFLQFFPVLIGLLVIVWLKRWWTVFPVCLFVFGGLCNFIDRFVIEGYSGVVYTNAVVDYLQFDGRTEKFNIPDAFIIIGAALALVALLLSTLIGMFKKTPPKTEAQQATAPNEAVKVPNQAKGV